MTKGLLPQNQTHTSLFLFLGNLGCQHGALLKHKAQASFSSQLSAGTGSDHAFAGLQALGNKARPHRTGFGKAGKPIKVNVNHYRVSLTHFP